MNAVPTPRFEVGAKEFAAQLLYQDNRQFILRVTEFTNLHYKWEQAVVSAYNQEKRKIRRPHTFLDASRKDDITNEWNSCGEHDMEASVAGTITIPCLENHHEPSNGVWSHCHPLSINGWKPKLIDELNVWMSDCYSGYMVWSFFYRGQEIRDCRYSNVDWEHGQKWFGDIYVEHISQLA